MKFSHLIAKIFGEGTSDKKLKKDETNEVTRITAIDNELERLHKLAEEEMEKRGIVSWEIKQYLAEEEMEKRGIVSWEIKQTITELSAQLIESEE